MPLDAPRSLRVAALLLVGFAMLAVLGGVVADRILKGVSVSGALGVAAGSPGSRWSARGSPAGGFPPASGRP